MSEAADAEVDIERVLMLADLPPSVHPTERERALSLLLARQMETEPAVRAFRDAQKLTGELVPWDGLERWIEEKQPVSGVPETLYALVPLPVSPLKLVTLADDTKVEITLTAAAVRRLNPRWLELEYALPGNTRKRTRHISGSSELEHLYHVANLIAGQTSWSLAQATIFVVTGEVPLTTQLDIEVIVNVRYPALTKFVLKADPRLSPRELADRFRQIRLTWLGTRHREITPKHLQLAMFAITADLDPESQNESLQARMERWNERYPQWAYREIRNFSRDIGLASKRLLGQTKRGRK